MNKQQFEIRSANLVAENESRTLSGYVVQWNKPSEVLWGEFVEIFAHGAFSQSLAEGADIRALFEHDHTKLLGRTSSSTLSLQEDSLGLRFRLDLPNTQLGNDILESVKRGDIRGMSFGFLPIVEEWDETAPIAKRTIKQAELFEITITSVPAYPDSCLELAKRSMLNARKSQKKTTALCKRWLELMEL